MSLATDSGEYISAAGRASPPLAVSGVMVAGFSLQDWVLIATLTYTVLQTALLIYNFFKRRRNGG